MYRALCVCCCVFPPLRLLRSQLFREFCEEMIVPEIRGDLILLGGGLQKK